MLRAAIASGSALGRSVEDALSKGGLVADEIVVMLVAERLQKADCADGAVFDGFPRTIGQARILDALLAGRKAAVDLVINLLIDDDALWKRIEQRKSDGSARPDDTAATLKDRLVAYHRTVPPLLEYYKLQGKLDSVNSMEPIVAVRDAITRAVHRQERSRLSPIS